MPGIQWPGPIPQASYARQLNKRASFLLLITHFWSQTRSACAANATTSKYSPRSFRTIPGCSGLPFPDSGRPFQSGLQCQQQIFPASGTLFCFKYRLPNRIRLRSVKVFAFTRDGEGVLMQKLQGANQGLPISSYRVPRLPRLLLHLPVAHLPGNFRVCLRGVTASLDSLAEIKLAAGEILRSTRARS